MPLSRNRAAFFRASSQRAAVLQRALARLQTAQVSAASPAITASRGGASARRADKQIDARALAGRRTGRFGYAQLLRSSRSSFLDYFPPASYMATDGFPAFRTLFRRAFSFAPRAIRTQMIHRKKYHEEKRETVAVNGKKFPI